MSVSVLDVLKRFDAYPKTLEDFRIKTLGGGTITLISAIVMLFLFVSEIQDYLAPGIAYQYFSRNFYSKSKFFHCHLKQ
jgi:hypothetical protein